MATMVMTTTTRAILTAVAVTVKHTIHYYFVIGHLQGNRALE
jgi:hypothetical protein